MDKREAEEAIQTAFEQAEGQPKGQAVEGDSLLETVIDKLAARDELAEGLPGARKTESDEEVSAALDLGQGGGIFGEDRPGYSADPLLAELQEQVGF
jgi:hypothetical protein